MRRGPGVARILQLACGLQLALIAVLTATVVSGVWQLAAIPTAVLFAFGAGQVKLGHFRNRRFRTSWEPFDVARHPNTARFFNGLCDRYGISNIKLVQGATTISDSEVGIAAVTMVGRTPHIILNPAALAWAGDDSLYLQKVLSHELTHVLRDHPTVRPACTRLILTAPLTVFTAGLAAWVASGAPSTGTTWLAGATTAFSLGVTAGWQPKVFRPFVSWLRKRFEAEAERGTVGLCGPANTVLVAVQSVASDVNPSIEGGFDRPAGGAYF
ncbi:MAG: M48 family metalloprotease, partial [Acidimicrobiia bacterium]